MAEGDFVNTVQPRDARLPVVRNVTGKQVEIGELVASGRTYQRVAPSGSTAYVAGTSPEVTYIPVRVSPF